MSGKHPVLIQYMPLLATWDWRSSLSFSSPIFKSSILSALQTHQEDLYGNEYDSALRAEKSYVSTRYYTLLFLFAISYGAVQGTSHVPRD